mmetsp:Transcript_12551/g.22779  ORF Transcript_12551/g.22779 Transcript_12551/m.22779 type:complete len:389 (-) Transcript_12551:1168-2334(-)|eukprot:CAMPEP_0203744152 /NCGR_PEP_ID=MMETSP0098-20131031/324_1 /ASSEMBLY_ACC=CAM_ASM_000208 /TAXON_ID=96639 /ORGANISM=" , Strain NY0313808BC1" /LENGTH=388 /DNA_ID=CAMNT_0050631595 /DNA_START=68 /DNA_END=1234 /DNA_ORIENTATION=+
MKSELENRIVFEEVEEDKTKRKVDLEPPKHRMKKQRTTDEIVAGFENLNPPGSSSADDDIFAEAREEEPNANEDIGNFYPLLLEPETKDRLEIEFDSPGTSWKDSYIRTRHKNLRCFPSCSSKHMHNGFCGNPVLVYVNSESEFLREQDRLVAVAELRKVDGAQTYTAGGKFEQAASKNKDGNEILVGNWVSYDSVNQRHLVEFKPPRRWRYNCKLAKHTMSQKHVFTVYVCSMKRKLCLAEKNSPEFMLNSAWKVWKPPGDVTNERMRANSLTMSNSGNDSTISSVMDPFKSSPSMPLTSSFPLLYNQLVSNTQQNKTGYNSLLPMHPSMLGLLLPNQLLPNNNTQSALDQRTTARQLSSDDLYGPRRDVAKEQDNQALLSAMFGLK